MGFGRGTAGLQTSLGKQPQPCEHTGKGALQLIMLVAECGAGQACCRCWNGEDRTEGCGGRSEVRLHNQVSDNRCPWGGGEDSCALLLVRKRNTHPVLS